MTKAAADVELERVWKGAPALEPFLIPIAELEPFPGNPRRGNVPAVKASLERFGQVKASVTRDGGRIIAGHHVVLAATELGWTHIAAPPHDFESEEEQRAFLLADNRSSDLGAYEQELLVEHLKALAETDSLAGTGYDVDDLDGLLAQLRRQAEDPVLPPDPDPSPLPAPVDLREVVLLYSQEQRDQLELWLKVVAKEKGTEGVSETVYAALRIAALVVHQGATPADDGAPIPAA